MAFDSTISSTTSNSYISVEYADAYFAFHLEGEQYWNTLPLLKKQSALVQSTNRIDAETFTGDVAVYNQRLQWPREWVPSRIDTGYLIAAAQPKELIDATCEMALHYLKQSAGEFMASDDEIETLTNVKVGPLDYSMKSNLKGDRLPTKVKNLLSNIGWTGGDAIKYVR